MSKMVPQPTPETQMYWDKARSRELWLPKCVDTGRFFFPPRAFSPFSGGAIRWERVSGRGRLVSFVINHRPAPGYETEVPYVIALIEMEEGPRLTSNLPGAAPDPGALKIAASVEVTFEERGEVIIPQFMLVNNP